jgi:hypothetical protein
LKGSASGVKVFQQETFALLLTERGRSPSAADELAGNAGSWDNSRSADFKPTHHRNGGFAILTGRRGFQKGSRVQ